MRDLKKRKMTGWYDPVQLSKTALEVVISTIFGRNADRRILQALADPGNLRKKCYYEVTGHSDKEFWFDYIADVGDGFNSTYTMAYFLTRPALTLKVRERSGQSSSSKDLYGTERGQMLILGG